MDCTTSSALKTLAETLIKKAKELKWSADKPWERQSWVDYAKETNALRDEAGLFESRFEDYSDSLYWLGSIMSELVCEHGNDGDDKVRKAKRSFDYVIEQMKEFNEQRRRIFSLLNIYNEPGSDMPYSEIDPIAMERIVWIHALELEFSHDTRNYIANLATLCPENIGKFDLKKISATGDHIIAVSRGILDSLYPILVEQSDFKAGIVSVLSEFFNRRYNRHPNKLEIVYENLRSDQRGDITGGAYSLYRVFYNLVNNAMKRGNASRVKILASDGILDHVDAVKLQVMDNGTGLPDADDVFEWGISYSGGTGLGLAMARRIIQDHHGKLTAISHYTDPAYNGACFEVVLPKRQSEGYLSPSRKL
ncbi:MAG: sensor histidine kinase [Nanoarchaeota archaeon]|nr:sensor histidine kinase [Nanoarchaeota archaeon]MBU1004314.1 sensor histidine kinase [Nanoarchaeota archaeon]MBU1945468.1 sensor histidine kinase [Nanoarchaeota archaeon]